MANAVANAGANASNASPVQEWGSRIGVILAVAGSAVGLGNFLRFPGNAAHHGGGAFMIPYFCALIFLGIPIGWVEWTIGRYGGRKGFHSAPAIFGVVARGPIGRYLGVVGVLIPLGVYYYYVLIESWCLAYFWAYASGSLDVGGGGHEAEVAASSAFFAQVTGSGGDGSVFARGLSGPLAFFLVTCALNSWWVFRGLSKGVEWVCKWAMPVMAALGLVVLGRVLTLGTPDPAYPDRSVLHGLGFMWNPDFSALGDFQTWLAAAGQIFFSLSVGFGVIVNYASYLKRDDDVVLSGLTASATNEFFEVALGGLITLTAAVCFVGVTAASAAGGSSFDLGFRMLPVVFLHMPFGRFFGAAWFLMLFLAAITSSLSMLQPAQAFVEEAFGISRGKATAWVSLWALGGSAFVIYFSGGLVALDTVDFWVGSFMIFIVAGLQIVLFSWVFGVDRGLEEAHRGAQLRIPGFYRFVLRWVSPAYLVVVFVGFCWQQIPGYLRTILGDAEQGVAPNLTAIYSWGLILATVAGLLAVTYLGARRWRAAGLDLDGREPPPGSAVSQGGAR